VAIHLLGHSACEEALVRLEVGLRAQREHLHARPALHTTARGICPSDSDGAYQEPEKFSSSPPLTRAAFCARDVTQHLPRAAQLRPTPGLALGNPGRVQAPDTFNFQPLHHGASESPPSSSPTVDHRRNWRLPQFILIPTVIGTLVGYHFLTGGAFPGRELVAVNSEVVEPARIRTIEPEPGFPTEANSQVNNQLSNDSVPSSQTEIALPSTTSISPGASAQPATSIQASVPPAIANQSTMPVPIKLPSGDAASSAKPFHHGRRTRSSLGRHD
jgi:hypothetical protein